MSKDYENRVFTTVTIGILTTIISGLVFFIFSFFNSTFPRAQARIDVLEKQVKMNDDKLNNIFHKIDRIYDILIERSDEKH